MFFKNESSIEKAPPTKVEGFQMFLFNQGCEKAFPRMRKDAKKHFQKAAKFGIFPKLIRLILV